MELDLPYWFKQRQAKAEEVGNGTYKVSGPNLNPGVILVRMSDDMRWQAALKADPSGTDVVATDSVFSNAREAMAAAFELYRTHMIV